MTASIAPSLAGRPVRSLATSLILFVVSAAPALAGSNSGPFARLPFAGESLIGSDGVDALATDALRPVERAFLEKAAQLSRQQIQLAQLAVSQATGSDVRTYAQQMAGDHRQIGDSIEALRRKKGTSAGGSPEAVVPESFQQLAQKSGGDFDREFVRLAGDLQATLLTLFEEVMADAKDPEVRELAGAHLPTLRDHQNRATELKKAYD